MSLTVTGYEPVVAGDPSGWALGAATTSTVKNATVTNPDDSSALVDLVTTTRYDSEGREIERRLPASNGTDAGATRTSYYVAGGNPANPCESHPEWAGLLCQTGPVGAPSSGPTLPTRTVTGYSALLSPTVTTEISGGVTRTTTITYLSDGRPETSRTSLTGLAGSTPIAGAKTVYGAQGTPTETRQIAPGAGPITETGNATVTGHDGWGRTTSYSTTEGGAADTTTTEYDAAGRVWRVTTNAQVSTVTYDAATEHRGLPTALTVTRGGGLPDLAFAASYNVAGQLSVQTLPGGISQSTTYDEVGEPDTRSYSGPVTDPSTGTTSSGNWLSWNQDNDVLGRVRHEWTPDGAAFVGPDTATNPVADPGDALGYDRTYSYDQAGRLVHVTDRTAAVTGVDVNDPTTTGEQAPCTTRTYGFDRNSNRVSLGRSTATDGTCPANGSTIARHSLDTADRVVSGPDGVGAYVYDLLGRATTVPAGDTPNGVGDLTVGYFDSDLVASLSHNGSTTSFTLDAAGRRRTATTTGVGAHTLVRHYTDGSDNPGWQDDTVDGVTTTTRFVESLGGDLGLTVTATGEASVPLATLHGDVITSVTVPSTGATTGINGWSDYDEYGNPRDPAAARAVAGSAGYGWIGGKQRATSDTGLLLMGVRLYNPMTGRFLQTDPIVGGNANAYDYCSADPINCFDLDGRFGWKKWLKRAATVASVAAFATCVVATAGVCFAAGIAATAVAVTSRGANTNWHSSGSRNAFFRGAAFDVGLNFLGGSGMRAGVSRSEHWMMGGGRAGWRKGRSLAEGASRIGGRRGRDGARFVYRYRMARTWAGTGGFGLID